MAQLLLNISKSWFAKRGENHALIRSLLVIGNFISNQWLSLRMLLEHEGGRHCSCASTYSAGTTSRVEVPAPVVVASPPIVQVPASVVVASPGLSQTTTSTSWGNGTVEQKKTTRSADGTLEHQTTTTWNDGDPLSQTTITTTTSR